MPIKTRSAPKKTRRKKRKSKRIRVGWREWVGFPELGVEAIRAKIDTGARSSSLHARNIMLFDQDGERWVSFDIVLDHARERGHIPCKVPVADIRSIKNSFGVSEERVIIETMMRIGAGIWPVEISLADRREMTFPALLGRTALRGRATIDPGRSYLCKWVDEEDLPPLPKAAKPKSGGN